MERIGLAIVGVAAFVVGMQFLGSVLSAAFAAALASIGIGA